MQRAWYRAPPLKRSVMLLPKPADHMRSRLVIIVSVLLLTESGCCRPYYGDLPSRPAHVNGWNKTRFNTLLIIGSFVLKKGESAENEKLGVRLIDLEPSRVCGYVFAEPTNARIKLSFYDPSNHATLCNTVINAVGSFNASGNLGCPANDKLPPGFQVRSFNAKDGWVWLELTSTVGDARW